MDSRKRRVKAVSARPTKMRTERRKKITATLKMAT